MSIIVDVWDGIDMVDNTRVEYGLEHMIDEKSDYYAIICVEFNVGGPDKRIVGFIDKLDTDKPVVILQENIDIISLFRLIDRIRKEFPSLGWKE